MLRPAVRRRFNAVVAAIVPQNLRNPYPVVVKNRPAAHGLRIPVHFHIAPMLNGFFILPKGKRQNLAGFAQTLKPLDRNKTVDF